MSTATTTEPLPLFRKFPALAAKLPHVSLGIFPTPVEKVDQLGSALGLDRFYMKRDDLSGAVYGGNKVRMLEFLLGGLIRATVQNGTLPGFIQPDGSSPIGIAGYINAGFELKEQIDVGLLPEPDRIYVPLGSMGTTIGLMLGLKFDKEGFNR